MAELRRLSGDRTVLLAREHLVGRGPQCLLRLTGAYVSGQHALVRWRGSSWEVIDRGSRNGTQLNGAPLEPGRAAPLAKGSVLSFGHAEESWTLADASPPSVMILELSSGEALLGSAGVIGVPSAADPECTLYAASGDWLLERSDGSQVRLSDGDVFETRGHSYRFCAPSSGGTTTSALSGTGDPVELRFAVSSDEEFVELWLEYPNRSVSLGARQHNYLLLLLARSDQSDAQAGVPEAARGWLDKDRLADGLRVTPQALDGEIFRIRKHFAQHGLPEAATIIERRPRTKQLRLGIRQYRIERT